MKSVYILLSLVHVTVGNPLATNCTNCPKYNVINTKPVETRCYDNIQWVETQAKKVEDENGKIVKGIQIIFEI